ncbi:MAG: PTS system mannose/fructose/sorbose family transporter subunit IID [Spirochaetia bacterium]
MESKRLIDKKTLNNMAFRSMFLQASFNYERMQACGWLFSIMPGLKAIFKNDPNKLKDAQRRHMEFFNTHPFLVTSIMGLTLAMEEKGEDPELIRGMKVAMMGPLGGIGDAIFWFTLIPIAASFGASLALSGNVLGPILFLIIFNMVHLPLRWGLMHSFYKLGLEAFDKLKAVTVHFQKAATIVGLTVIGALIASYVRFQLALEFAVGSGEAQKTVNVQSEIVDAIMPNLLPLTLTLTIFYFIAKKGVKPTTIIWLLIGLGLVGSFFGIV